MMKRGSTHFLRLVIILIGLGVLALCIFALPSMLAGASAEFPYATQSVFLIIGGLYIATLPFFIALWQSFKLLHYIDRNKAFSELSVKALKNIKYCASSITVIFAAFVPLLFPIADMDDAPGLILFGAGIAGIPIVIAVFAAILEQLLKNAIEMKSENDLTV